MLRAALTSALLVYAQATQRKRAWLLRLSGAACPHAEQRWLVWAGLTFWTRAGAFCSRRRTSWPQLEEAIPRLRAALAVTFRLGASAVPLADQVMPAMCRSSTRMTSNRPAMAVVVFSHQSLRRSVSRARSRAA